MFLVKLIQELGLIFIGDHNFNAILGFWIF